MYPIISYMIRDLLTIQISTITLESILSIVGQIIDEFGHRDGAYTYVPKRLVIDRNMVLRIRCCRYCTGHARLSS